MKRMTVMVKKRETCPQPVEVETVIEQQATSTEDMYTIRWSELERMSPNELVRSIFWMVFAARLQERNGESVAHVAARHNADRGVPIKSRILSSLKETYMSRGGGARGVAAVIVGLRSRPLANLFYYFYWDDAPQGFFFWHVMRRQVL